MTESLPRFLVSWALMNMAPAVVVPPFLLRAVSGGDSANDVAGMLAVGGIACFLVLLGVAIGRSCGSAAAIQSHGGP